MMETTRAKIVGSAIDLFAASGYTVFATDRDPAARDAWAATAGVHPVRLDVSDERQIHRAVVDSA